VERSELVAALQRLPLFATVPVAVLEEELVPLVHVRKIAPGTLLFSEGEPARALPLLLSGQVKLARLAADGREQVLHVVRAPASFAEAAVFGPGVFPATAEVIKGGELAEIGRPGLLALLHRRPEVTLAMLASMSVWLRRLVDLVEGLSLRTVEERVAGYFVSVAARRGVPLQSGVQLRLEDTKRLIAAACGTAPEVLSRTFRKLATQNLLRVEGAAVTILDAAALLRLARGERA
jgi:CRP/FNR family transcriptional regulator